MARRTEEPSFEEKAGFFDRLFVGWFMKLLRLGAKEKLELRHLGRVHPQDEAEIHYKLLKKYWEAEIAKKGMRDARLLVALVNFKGCCYIVTILFVSCVMASTGVLLPQFKKTVLEWLEGTREMSDVSLYIHLGLITIMPILTGYADLWMGTTTGRSATHIYAAVATEIFNKSLRLSATARNAVSSGKLVNLLSNDAMAVCGCIEQLCSFVTLVPQLIATLVLVYNEVGWTMIGALTPLILSMPLQLKVATKTANYQAIKKEHSDGRIKYLTDVVNGIRVIKPYAWEKMFWNKTNESRKLELLALKGSKSWQEFGIIMLMQLPDFMPVSVFALFVITGGEVSPASMFTVIQYFAALSGLVSALPGLVGQIVMLKVTFERLGGFLRMDEAQERGNNLPENDKTVISISKDAIFQWSDPNVPSWKLGLPPTNQERKLAKALAKSDPSISNGEKTIEVHWKMQNVGFTVQKGQLVGIVGPIGSGKSSLLSAVLGEMIQMSGTSACCGSKTYSMQQPWIQSSTLRDNILFGSAYVESWYQQVITACALTTDIQLMEDGDLTEIGDRGTNLSGGQKARVSVARCVYSKAEIVFLDDPLAAVDMHVGDTIFDKAICQVLRDKTVLLVTNQLNRLQNADLILVLEGGSIREMGTMSELVDAQKEFAQQLNAAGVEGKSIEEEKSTAVEVTRGKEDLKEDSKDALSKKAQPGSSAPKRLTKEEESEEGFVDFRVYLWYIKHCNIRFVMVSVIMTIVFVSIVQGRQLTYGVWANDLQVLRMDNPDVDTSSSSWKWMSVLLGLQVLMIIICYIGGLGFVKASMSGARSIQEQLWDAIFNAPVGFYDVTPVGQILNLVTMDTMFTDAVISQVFRASYLTIMMFASTLVGIMMSTRGTLLPFAAAALFLFYKLICIVRKTAVQLQRLSKAMFGPITTSLAQMLAGISVVRAQGHEGRFSKNHILAVNDGTLTSIVADVMLNPFVMFRVGCVGGLVNGATTTYAVVAAKIGHSSSVGMAGVAFTLAGQLSMVMMMITGLAINLETIMTSVERIKSFTEKTPREKVAHVDGVLPPAWPHEGKIRFADYVTGYRDGPDILKSITAEIHSLEKIGVVGRSGSGKSTIVQSLFRLIEPRNGTIYIDGIDTTKIGLAQLRSSLGLIPQDPILFIGSVSYNIDPTGESGEARLWEILEQTNMAKDIRSLPNQLEYEVAEGGSNFSVGQRQMICICRALLNNPKILCLDEATASVDNDADALIQELVRTLFKMQTVITIAHRLDTIMDSDRIMVLDKGHLAEFGAALELLEMSEGIFKGLVQAGNVANLRKIAKHGYLAKVMCV